MTETKQLRWQIDGEWLTNFARTWFWDEDKPYETCAELLGSCIQTDDELLKEDIIRDILEGRKKFVGINEFSLVDDNERVRPISKKVDQLKRQNAILRIKEKIRCHGINYVDPYSTVKSFKEARNHDVHTEEDCIIWFHYADWDMREAVRDKDSVTKLPAAESPTKAGLWLFDEPELVYEATEHEKFHVSSTEFWDNIYELTKDRKGFEERSMFYKYKKQVRKENDEEKPDQTFSHINDNLEWCAEPHIDNTLPCWSGIISPDGDFYPADYGSHNTVAYHILCWNAEKLDVEYTTIEDKERRVTIWSGDSDKALDALVDMGYVACRYLPTKGKYIEYKGRDDVLPEWAPTREQKDTLWKIIGIHNDTINSSIVPKIFF